MPLTKYSVLLLYPDYLSSDYGTETYYTFVEAECPADAVALAQDEAGADNEIYFGLSEDLAEGELPTYSVEDFHPLLLTKGFNESIPENLYIGDNHA